MRQIKLFINSFIFIPLLQYTMVVNSITLGILFHFIRTTFQLLNLVRKLNFQALLSIYFRQPSPGPTLIVVHSLHLDPLCNPNIFINVVNNGLIRWIETVVIHCFLFSLHLSDRFHYIFKIKFPLNTFRLKRVTDSCSYA